MVQFSSTSWCLNFFSSLRFRLYVKFLKAYSVYIQVLVSIIVPAHDSLLVHASSIKTLMSYHSSTWEQSAAWQAFVFLHCSSCTILWQCDHWGSETDLSHTPTHQHTRFIIGLFSLSLFYTVSWSQLITITHDVCLFFLSSRTFYFILAPPMVLLGDFLIILYKLEKASFIFSVCAIQ